MNASRDKIECKAILRINEQYITGSDLVQYLKFQGKEVLLEDLLEHALVRQGCLELGIFAEQEETFEYIDAYRAEHNLFAEEETRKWLEDRNLSDEDFFRYAEAQVLLRKLKEHLAKDKLEQCYIYEKAALDRVELYHIGLDDESVARELVALMAEGSEFYGLAKTYNQEERTRQLCGYIGIISRKDLSPEVENLVFSSNAGSIVGPVKCTGQFHIYRIERFYPASLDAKTAELLRDKLFREWLTTKRQVSKIEWLK